MSTSRNNKKDRRRQKKKKKAIQYNERKELHRQRELEKTRISKQREIERSEKEIGGRREHLKEERLRRRQMRKKEELEFQKMREKVELMRKKEELRLQKIREKEERKRKKAEEARVKKETQKWEKEIRDEEKRRERERKKAEKRKPPFEIIKVGSSSTKNYTSYFDSYTIKINKYPIDPVKAFQEAINITINERGLVKGDKIRLIISHPTWAYPFSKKLITITKNKDFMYEMIKLALEFKEYKSAPLEELLIEVQSTKIPRGTGRLKIDKNNIANKRSIICIKNTDTVCLARAIVTAQANINKSKWTQSQLKNGFNKSRKLQEEEAFKALRESRGRN